jgi:catechol 2,3-dioxygenase-like lactoylglutathione lyase family enzyme
MSSTELTDHAAATGPRPAGIPMRLEVVVVPVADVDRAKAFYEGLGWRVDADVAEDEDYRVVQVTPPASEASVIFGKGVTSAQPGSTDRIVLAVDDIEAARAELISRGVDVGEPFHEADGGLDGGFHAAAAERAAGRDPEGRSYATYAAFSDPDGNQWLLQELTERLPGRVWSTDAEDLADLLRETGRRHGAFETAAEPHDWADWYAAYMVARRAGHDRDGASAAADRYMRDVKGVGLLSA